MNDSLVFIYFLCFAVVVGATFAYMYAMMTSTLKDFNRQQESIKQNLHPEMRDVKSGESLLCLLYTSDAADEEDSVDLGGRRIIKKK